MSYSGYKSSPRGSRGYSSRGYSSYRGSSRGGGDGGGWRGSGSRGYSSSSRGSRGGRYSSNSGKWDRESSSYESRPKYYGGGERYSSQSGTRPDGGSYRSYRNEDSISSYTSRDHSHRASSPDRKRMRPDYSPASSVHRSHEYGDSNEFSSRSYGGNSGGGGYEGKRMSGGYPGAEDRRTMSFREERDRIRSDDYQFRKPLNVGRFSRGTGYRGRSFSRGLRSSFRREPSSYHPRGGFIRKRPMEGGYGNRRIATGKTQEYLRRLKLYRMQRLKRLQAEGGELDSDDNDDEEVEEVEEEEEIEEEVTDEDQEGNDADSKVKTENEDVEMREDEEGGEEKKDEEKKVKKVKKIIKVIKKIKRKLPKKEEDEEDDDVKEKDENSEQKDLHVTVTQDSEGRDVETPVRTNYLGQPFMKLECPHCHFKADTFKDYLNHLYKNKHQLAMTNLTMKVRKGLAKLRLEQRAEQRLIDEECKLKKMNMRTFYCLVCKLNYRSLKSEHMQSDKHKEMKKFTTPFCKVCRVTCRTPMLYENHVCSLDHLKRKFYYDKKNAERQEGGNDIDMDKFMVLDQVGSGEEDSDAESSEKEEDKDKEATTEEATGEDGEKVEKEKKPKKKKIAINLGSEYCKKMEIYFCDLCKTFLPRIEDQEQALAVHCRGRTHLHWYVKKKDDLALRKRAERIHRLRVEMKKAESKEEVKDEPMDEDAPQEELKTDKDTKNASEKSGDVEPEGGMNEKLWTEVSKDISEILKEVEEPGNKSSDDEEDSRAAGRRYDRFKHSEKGKLAADESESKSSEDKGVKAEIVNGDDKDDA